MSENEKDWKQDNERSLANETEAGGDTEAIEREELPEEQARYAYEDEQAAREGEDDVNEAAPEEEDAELAAAGAASAGAVSGPNRGPGKAWMYISLGLAVILIIVLIKPPFGASSDKKAVGSVNGVAITKDNLYDAMIKLGGEQTMNNLIQEELVNQEADKAGVKITDADVDKEIDSIKKQYGTDEAFQSALQQYGMTIDMLREQTPMQLQIRKILEPQAKVTDKDIEDYFNQNKAQYDQAEQVKASHILVATKEEADAILKQLKDGADFATLAKEKSTDTGSKDNGGDLGFFGKGAMDPAFEAAAFALKVGETTSEPVKSQYGYHIIKVTDRKEAKAATLADHKDEIKEQLVRTKISDLSTNWLADLKAKSKITNSLATEDPTATDAAGAATGANNSATNSATNGTNAAQ